MNFTEALTLIVRENEKVSRALWRDPEWRSPNGGTYDPGTKLWIMALHPSMFGLPHDGDHYFQAFEHFGARPSDMQPRLLFVRLGPERAGYVERHTSVNDWHPDMSDMLATDWEIADTRP